MNDMQDPLPDADLSTLAINMRCTADAIDSALLLVDFAIPKFQALELSELQMIDTDRGTLSPADAHRAMLTLLSELSDARYALNAALPHLKAVADRAEGIYPNAPA